jgi:hypothetical protein
VVSILIFRSLPGEETYAALAEATVEDGALTARGPRADLLDTQRAVYSQRVDEMVEFDEDAEEWLRSFAEGFRTAQVGALIVADNDHPELVAPRETIDAIRQPLSAH